MRVGTLRTESVAFISSTIRCTSLVTENEGVDGGVIRYYYGKEAKRDGPHS